MLLDLGPCVSKSLQESSDEDEEEEEEEEEAELLAAICQCLRLSFQVLLKCIQPPLEPLYTS